MNNRRWLGGLLGAGIVAAAVAGVVTARAGAAQPASGSLDASLGGRVVVFPAADRDTAAGGSSPAPTRPHRMLPARQVQPGIRRSIRRP